MPWVGRGPFLSCSVFIFLYIDIVTEAAFKPVLEIGSLASAVAAWCSLLASLVPYPALLRPIRTA